MLDARGVACIVTDRDVCLAFAGAEAKCVLIEKRWGSPIVCNDGVTIAKEFELEDPDENLGAALMRASS